MSITIVSASLRAVAVGVLGSPVRYLASHETDARRRSLFFSFSLAVGAALGITSYIAVSVSLKIVAVGAGLG